MSVYLDNCATTKPYDEVVDGMVENLKNNYGNPSSLHQLGFNAEKKIKEAKQIISKILKVQPKEMFFTSGGTESNNLAILGTCRAMNRRGKHIITSAVEHPSVLKVFEYLENEQGYEVTYVPVDKDGIIDVDFLYGEVREDTVLVSIMHVNNETGSVQPIKDIGNKIKKISPEIVFHVDGVQSFGKQKVALEQSKIDLFSVSGHKIHGPKGVGFLYINSKINIRPIIYGGFQQLGVRSGTENVPGVVGLTIAVEKICKSMLKNQKDIKCLKEKLYNGISENIEDIALNGALDKTANNILNVSFSDVKSEVLLHALEEKEIYVSSGSACSSNKPEKSHVLKAMCKEDAVIDGSLRFSLSEMNDEAQIDKCVAALIEIVPRLRKFIRK